MTRLRPPALVLGVPIASVTMTDTLDLVGELVTEGRAHGRTCQIATVNVDFLVNAVDQQAVADILQQADLCLADGMPVVWAARLLGTHIPERVAGSDLVPLLVEASTHTGWHVHFFGSSPDVADAARQLLRSRYPNARFSIDPGPMIPDVAAIDDEVLDAIAEVDADILCVALGNPKQEYFIKAHRERLRCPVMIGIGGSLDMLVGKRRRAPRWIQRLGMEWVVRALQEPRRLGRRYARDIRVFVPALMRARRRQRARRDVVGLKIRVFPDRVDVTFDGETLPSDAAWAAAADACTRSPLRVAVGDARSPTDAAIARLAGLAKVASRWGQPVVWDPSTELLRSQLRTRGLGDAVLGLHTAVTASQPDAEP